MKLQHFTIIFLIIILPFSIICRNTMSNYSLMLKDRVRLNNVVDAATQDALDILVELNDEFQMLYFDERFDINQTLAKESVKSFFQTMAINFNMPYIPNDTEAYFSMYIPAIVIIGYDGFFIYSVDETPTAGFSYQMSPKIPYAYYDEDSGTVIHFTLGNYVTLFTNNRLYQGEISCNYEEEAKAKYDEFYNAFGNNASDTLLYLPELTSDMSTILYALNKVNPAYVPDFLVPGSQASGATPFMRDYGSGDEEPSDFHAVRRSVIISTIKETLQEEINEHETYAKRLGSMYHFELPEIANDEWINSINDISVMSFIQGMPIGTNQYYDNYALSGSRIVQTDYIYGTSDNYYHSTVCDEVVNFLNGGASSVVDIFINRVQAAEAGYYPCNECHP